MDITKVKNGFGIALVVLIAAALVFAVVFTAVQANKRADESELFIDASPAIYGSGDVVYTSEFSRAVAKLLGDYADYIGEEAPSSQTVNALINACKDARIPAEKLSDIVKAMRNFTLDLGGINLVIDENTQASEVLGLIRAGGSSALSQILRQFFRNSKLTEDEFSRFLWYFMYDYSASASYKAQMTAIGKNGFIALFSNTLYILNAVFPDGSEALKNQTAALSAALYEIGTSYASTVKTAGSVAVEKVFKLDFDLDEDFGGKSGELLGAIGCVMRQCDKKTLEAVLSDAESDAQKISQGISTAKAIDLGLKEFFASETASVLYFAEYFEAVEDLVVIGSEFKTGITEKLVKADAAVKTLSDAAASNADLLSASDDIRLITEVLAQYLGHVVFLRLRA